MYKLFIAWRFLWSRLVSYVGAGLLALMVMIFIIVMAVMEGMGDLLRENIRKTDAHVQILAPAGPGIVNWKRLAEEVSEVEHVLGVTPFVRGMGQAEATHYSFPCLVRGVDLEAERRKDPEGRTVGGLGPYLSPPHIPEDFSFEPREAGEFPRALVGHRIAKQMEIADCDRVRLSVQQFDAERTGRMMFEIATDFKTDSIWFDNNLLISLKDAQRILGTGDRVTGLGVWIDDHVLARQVKRDIQMMLLKKSRCFLDEEEKRIFNLLSYHPQSAGDIARRAGISTRKAEDLVGGLIFKGAARKVVQRKKGTGGAKPPDRYVEYTEPQVKTWAEQHPDLFSAVAHEATLMRIILYIIIASVAMVVLCLLWVLVEQKVRDIGILVALGARTGGVVSIFVLDGLIIGLVGTIIGLTFGILIAWQVDPIAEFLHLKVFPPEMFYGAEELPSTIRVRDLVIVSAVAIASSVLASILPAFRAAAADPIESLRHE